MGKIKVLIYEKSSHRTEELRRILESAGHYVRAAFSDSEAEGVAQKKNIDLLMSGFDNFPLPPALERITAIIIAPDGKYREVDALARTKSPPLMCVTYPFISESILAQIKRVTGKKKTPEAEKEPSGLVMPEIAGHSDAIKAARQMIAVAAGVPSTVLILGETGTGKELAARALHRLSKRGPFMALNCAALPESLLENELFGHEKGAFTGADRLHAGLFEAADGGTLFLDEVGDMSPSLQVKLLRVLESRSFYRLGGNKQVAIDTRIICATNRDIFELAQKGSFRRDLLYRINVVSINLPPLRERAEDIQMLAERFLKEFIELYNSPAEKFSPGVLQRMKRHQWPGNVRQLRHSIERAVIYCKQKIIEDIDFGAAQMASGDVPEIRDLVEMDFAKMKERVFAYYEKEYIRELLKHSDGSIKIVCEKSGMDRKTLYRKMKQYELDKKDYR